MNLQEAKNSILQHPGQFYVYLLKRPNGVPFYVGKGNCKGFRIEAHVREALSNKHKNKYKVNIIRKIFEAGEQIDYEIVFTNDEKVAFDKEMELISFFGIKNQGGVLSNMSDGGEGNCGNIMSDTSKKLISKALVGIKRSEETKKKISNSRKGKSSRLIGWHHSDDAKKKMSDARKGKSNGREGTHLSEETRKKISKSNKGQVPWTKGKNHSIEHCNKISKAKIGHSVSEETRKKISLSCKGKIRSEEYRKKMSEIKKGHPTSDETKKKLSISNVGKKHKSFSEEAKNKMRGKIPWNKGKKGLQYKKRESK